MSNTKKLFYLLLIIFLLELKTHCQDQNLYSTAINLGQITKINPKENTILYYKCQISSSINQKLALITVETQSESFISIYSSIDIGNNSFIQYPNFYNNTESCYYSSMDTCALSLPETNNNSFIIVYFSVQLSEPKNYTIQVNIENIFQVAVNHNYKIDFTSYQSGVIKLTGEALKNYQQAVLTLEYSGYQNIGRFKAYAAINQMPNTYSNRFESQAVGAFNQILILQPIPLNYSYFIIIQGDQNTKLDLGIKQFSPSSPKLNINQSLFYYSYKDINFQGSFSFNSNQNGTLNKDFLPILIDLASLTGYGTFSINYCNGMNKFDFQNVNGQGAEIFITVNERTKCFENAQKNGQLLLENLIVNVENIIWYFGFKIGIYEGNYPLTIRTGQSRFGTLLATQVNRTYLIQNLIDDNLTLYFNQLSQQILQFDIIQCQPRLLNKQQKCQTILTSQSDAIKSQSQLKEYYYKFSTKGSHKYSILIKHNSKFVNDSQYLLNLKSSNILETDLTFLRSQTNIIEENQYNYYVLNFTKIKKNNKMQIPNGSIVTITLIQKNGYCLLLTSLERQFPNFDMIFQSNSVVDFSWNGIKQYIINETTQAIYIGIKGNSQSIYTIQANLNTGDDLPSRYIRLADDNIQSFTLTNTQYGQQILIMYSSHSIPYNIIFYPEPSCIKYGYNLPISDDCKQIPNQFHEKTVYFKVSNGKIKNDYKFSVYVNSGFYILYENKPILIACQNFCYQIVYVIVKQKTNIIHRGMGYISNIQFPQSTINNGKLELECPINEGYPCTRQINATLIWGGSMQIYYQSLQSQQIQWISKPIEFQYLPKYLFMQIGHYSDINTAIFYSEGLSLKIFYNIFRISQNSSNLIQYEYPSTQTYMKLSIGNPLRRIHIVEFDQELIKNLNCQKNNNLCIATISVYPNLEAEYSSEYLNHGVGYYSSNTFQYYIFMNSPIRMSEQYSLSYFYYQQLNINTPLNIQVRPISSCHPQILMPKKGLNSHFGYISYYNNYTFSNSNISQSQVQFAVMADTACQFYVWLSDHQLTNIIQNIWTQLISNSKGQIYFVFSSQYYWKTQTFTISFKQKMGQIFLKKYQKNQNGQIITPTNQNSLIFCYNCTQLSYNPNNSWGISYLVRALTKQNKSQSVIVHEKGSAITILQNQRLQVLFNETILKTTFQYYSNNDFMLYITTNEGNQRVTVRQLYDQNDNFLLDQYINSNSNPWFKVRCKDRNIKLYIITIENILLKENPNNRNLQQSNNQSVQFPKVVLHVQQTGTIGLKRLYQGIALFDAFVQQQGLNCYQYVTPLVVGYETIVLDLIFSSNSLSIPNITYKTMIQSGIISSNFTKLSSGYRLKSPFKPNQTYQFCFYLKNDFQAQSISQQYYLLVQLPALKHILKQEALTKTISSQYDIYEYIAMQSQTLLVEVINCKSKSTLLGSSNYSDILTGRLSELHSYWTNNVTTIAQDTINQGYYYFGLKSNNQQVKYQIILHSLSNNTKLYFDKFKLVDNKISKVYIKQEESKKYLIVEIPKIQYSQIQNLKSIAYNIYLDNLISGSVYQSSVLAKCPFLAQGPLKNYTTTVYFDSKVQSNAQNFNPTIKIPIQEVPYIFNLTGSVFVALNNQTIEYSYYYDSTTFQLDSSDFAGKSHSFIIIILIILIIGSLFLAYLAFKKWKINKRKTQIAFEMANYNHAQNDISKSNQPNQRPNIQSNRRPLNENVDYNQFQNQSEFVSSKKEKKIEKALNENVGYGQFVDETM